MTSEEKDINPKYLELIKQLAAYKSRGDIQGAMQVYSEDIVLESPPFGQKAVGANDVLDQMGKFFTLFPDYAVALNRYQILPGEAERIQGVGDITMTLNKSVLGFSSPMLKATTPVAITFSFKQQHINYELFDFDLSHLLSQYRLTAEERGQLDGLLKPTVEVSE